LSAPEFIEYKFAPGKFGADAARIADSTSQGSPS
jgi:hypothetical protein